MVTRGLAADAGEARLLLGAGHILVNGQVGGKPGSLVRADVALARKKKRPFVSRGGGKLAGALDHFGCDPAGLVCLDMGCSTGGFTDCLLQRGAGRVYAVDVGYGVLAWKLRQDPRVVLLERTNGRYLDRGQVPEQPQLAVVDVSFISVTRLLEPLVRVGDACLQLLVLVKPQFELPRHQVPPGGVVRDPRLHQEAVTGVEAYSRTLGLHSQGSYCSPVSGHKGNKEFFVWLWRS